MTFDFASESKVSSYVKRNVREETKLKKSAKTRIKRDTRLVYLRHGVKKGEPTHTGFRILGLEVVCGLNTFIETTITQESPLFFPVHYNSEGCVR